ncbi:phage anti-repressor protein [Levilactobacillus spicheri DSM 15429]|nr:phage anti-repressor protein [Levilactobacillus spicheri DSM 15429]
MKNRQAVTTSLQVADTFGKNHRDVLRAIDDLKDVRNFAQMFLEASLPDSYGRDRRGYYMNRDGFSLLAMGFTGKTALEFKMDYIEAFNAMESQASLPMTPEEKLMLVMENANRANERLTGVEERMDDFESNQKLDPGQYAEISHGVGRAVNDYIQTHHLQLTRDQRSALYKDINGGLNYVCGVGSRTQIRQKDHDRAIKYIHDWEPTTATKMMMQQAELPLEV